MENFKSKEQKVLERFLSMSVKSTDEVFDAFKDIENAQYYDGGPLKRFLYIPGIRDDKVLLVAHADTVWDKNWNAEVNDLQQTLTFKYGVYRNTNLDANCGIGADDRAGCAILYLLKNSGHSILIVDGEEHKQIGSNFLKTEYPKIYDEINNHQYMLEFDKTGISEFKCYKIPVTSKFKTHIALKMKSYINSSKASTDIVTLCRDICGANLSVGYYNEHTTNEILVYNEWLKTYKRVSKLLAERQQKYEVVPKKQEEENVL